MTPDADELPAAVADAIERAADLAGDVADGGRATTGRPDQRRTTWRYRAARGNDPATIVAAAGAVARRLNPGHWTITTDDH